MVAHPFAEIETGGQAQRRREIDTGLLNDIGHAGFSPGQIYPN
jgi:hypothetical protein